MPDSSHFFMSTGNNNGGFGFGGGQRPFGAPGPGAFGGGGFASRPGTASRTAPSFAGEAPEPEKAERRPDPTPEFVRSTPPVQPRAKEARVTLTTKGFENVLFEQREKDFEFVVGDEHFWCSSVAAEFLSPKISRLRRSDSTFCRYRVETNDPSHLFSLFLSLCRGMEVVLNSSSSSFFMSLSEELENREMISALIDCKFPEGEMTTKNVISRLEERRAHGMDTLCDREIEFIASHLFEMDESSIRVLGFANLSQILNCTSLKIESEDWLCGLILRFIDQDVVYTGLLEHVLFEFLSESAISSFVDSSRRFIINNLTTPLWDSICRRMLLSSKQDLSRPWSVWSRYNGVVRTLSMDKSRPLDGIIAYLTKECGGNVSDKGVVAVTANLPANANANAEGSPKKVVDLTANSYFLSADSPNMSICYDFKERRVIPTGYSIRSREATSTSAQTAPVFGAPSQSSRANTPANGSAPDQNPRLRSWVIETSTDGVHWREVDRHENSSELCTTVPRVFTVSGQEECQHIRLRQIGKSSIGTNSFSISCFEVFGSLLDHP